VKPGKSDYLVPLRVTSSPAAAGILSRNSGPLTILGAFPSAVYLQAYDSTTVAILQPHATRMPIGMVMLNSVAAPASFAHVRSASLSAGRIVFDNYRVDVAGYHDVGMAYVGLPDSGRIHCARKLLAQWIPCAMPGVADVPAKSDINAHQLIGRGPGLTPAGDDLLAGFIAGAVAFGLDCRQIIESVRGVLQTSSATTAISRQLLLAACDGDGLPEIARCAESLTERSRDLDDLETTVLSLLAIGATSGYALAHGLILAAGAAADGGATLAANVTED
jgi:Protein of unknown function (DUF2877)